MIASQCFWKSFEHNPYLFCEERLCGPITEPANTWTNIGYLVVAILIFRSKDRPQRSREFFFWSSLSLFLGSTLFHATSSTFGKYADVSAMFFLSVTILSLALERVYRLSKKQALLTYVSLLFLSLTFLFTMGFGNLLFGFQLLLSVYLEWKNAKKNNDIQLIRVIYSLGILSVAFAMWLLDVYKILCIPKNHILTAHGVWHLLAAFSIWMFFSAYKNKEI